MRALHILLGLVLGIAGAGQVLADSAKEPLWLEVIDPYVEMHSGPGRGYPVFYVIEQGERVDIITRRPGWYEVRTQDGKTGWTTAAQISRTIQTTGEPADLPTVSYGDYLKNSWRAGFNAGQFSSGELQGSELFSATFGYRPLSWLGVELEAGKIFGTDIKGDFYGANLVLEPFSDWRISPIVLIGRGVMKIDSQPKLVPLEIDDSDFNHYGLGFNYYLGRNFLFKGEYRSYSVSTDDNNVSLEAWTIGFNSFFLNIKAVVLAAALVVTPAAWADTAKADISDINNEIFELGVFFGIINIEDFGSEFVPGISATFRASEDFFIQYNYLQADVSPSSYEKNQGKLFDGDDRTFRHYDLLIGYNLFQGEFFPSPAKANLSTLYIVGGVGDTEFGGESSLTYTLGIGYQVALTRRFGLHFDFRDYIYSSTLVSDKKRTVSATQISSGIKYSF